ncbi:MAG TPA: glutathione S-transferase N-terminal domain-containing protein [Solirubrobacteraceae bacterium]|nr:glutathione S-transferase N-terminal domain-containing protein [Solirubrobacteraceae bacterium]
MKLYVCYGTFGPAERHACARAHKALQAAGHRPQVVRTFGCYGTDRFFEGRRKVKALTGTYKVPTLVLDDGTILDESANIAAWAAANPAAGTPAPAGAPGASASG